MKFNAAFRGEGNSVTQPSEYFESPPQGKKQTYLFFRCWSVYLFSLVKNVFVWVFVFPYVFSSLRHSQTLRKVSPSAAVVCGRASLALAMLAVRGGLEKQRLLLGLVGAVRATPAPSTWGAPLGLGAITFAVITSTCTGLFTLISQPVVVNSLERPAFKMKPSWEPLVPLKSQFLPAVAWLCFGGRVEGIKLLMDFLLSDCHWVCPLM